MLCEGLVHREREDELVVIRTGLYLVEKPWSLLEHGAFKFVRCEVVDCHRHFLILVILIKIMILQMSLLLGSYDTPHKLHCRIVLPGISVAAFRLYHDSLQLP